MAKPILISLSPNTSFTDVILAGTILLKPWQWKEGPSQNLLKTKLKKLTGATHVWLTNAGRNSLWLALKSLQLSPGDEVVCQAFTCVAVPNAILASGAKPVFVDIKPNTFNLSPKDLQTKITSHTKAVIIQHNFGIPDDLKKIQSICQKHKLILIEDCAHSLGGEYEHRPLGSFGDLAIFSFGRDKVISSVFGGALVTKNQRLVKNINALATSLPYPSRSWIFTQLLHPLIFALAVPTYHFFSLGKLIIFLSQKLRLISMPVSRGDKSCRPDLIPAKLPEAQAKLALSQLARLDSFNTKRKKIASTYFKQLQPLSYALTLPVRKNGSIYLRFPILIDQPTKLIQSAKDRQIMLGDWYRPVIAPKGVDLRKLGYQPGSCPVAENQSLRVVNLPTHPKMTLKDADKICKLLKTYAHS